MNLPLASFNEGQSSTRTSKQSYKNVKENPHVLEPFAEFCNIP